MAITWTTFVPNTFNREIESVKTTHQGLVIGGLVTREVRVMSDIWCDADYTLVWNPETETREEVCLGYHFELCCQFGEAVPDISPELQARIDQLTQERAEKFRAEKARADAEKQAIREAKIRNTPEIGKQMRVIQGRKVPVGTVGKVFWLGDGRVGLALDDTRDARGRNANVAWVDAAYLVAA